MSGGNGATWGLVEASHYPAMVRSARNAGVDTSNWLLIKNDDSTRLLVRQEDHGRSMVTLRRFDNPRDAFLQLTAMRTALPISYATEHLII